MPSDVIPVIAGIVTFFVLFAAALAWAQVQTGKFRD